MSKQVKQIHLAAGVPGVTTRRSGAIRPPVARSTSARSRTWPRRLSAGKFDFFFLAEGLRLREQRGQIYDLDIVGRPDTFTVLAALAAVTNNIGLTGTINSTFNEPYEVRPPVRLPRSSVGWTDGLDTSSPAGMPFTGENFRRGGYLAQEDRYERARTFLRTAIELWDSWRGDEIVADQATGVFLSDPNAGRFAHHDAQFDIEGQFNVPRSPQGRPVIFQAGESEDGREFAASSADVIFSRYSRLAEGQAFYADMKKRLAKYGRGPDELLIMPRAEFVLGDTDAEAAELARSVRLAQVSPQTAINFLEQLWNTDLSDHDPDGPLPAIDPVDTDIAGLISQGRASARRHRDRPGDR